MNTILSAGGPVATSVAARTYVRPNNWTLRDPVYGDPAVVVHIEHAVRYTASLDDLRRITSSYLSHYENVPNPEKNRLRSVLNTAKFDLSLKESTYSSAVSTHNIYLEQWSLTNANNAYTAYKQALDWHNTVVVLYNATADTVSRPVYLPYIFMQGDTRQGWLARGKITAPGGISRTFYAESIERDFVRIGSKHNDINTGYRRDDLLTIDTGSDRLLEQLVAVSSEIVDTLDGALLAAHIGLHRGLSPDEASAVTWLLHPFGATESRGYKARLPTWVIDAGLAVSIPTQSVAPPALALTHSPANWDPGDTTARGVAALHRKHICTVISGGDEPRSTGSGALISPNGLILTCAHVLKGQSLSVVFAVGELRGTFAAMPVLVNQRADVAILRADGLQSTSWMNVRLGDLPDAGEKVVALGNPSLPSGELATAAISQGIVSSPETEYWGEPRIVADITVASGSSGGPLVSLETGEIIGVVVSVAKAGMSEDRAASGYYCLAAPCHRLRDWLGIQYVNRPSPE